MGIRASPVYPGERNGAGEVCAGEAHAIVGPKQDVMYAPFNGRQYNIFFYQLADGSGWIHDFQRGNPGVRNLEVMPAAQAQLEAARHQEAHPKPCCCVCCRHSGVGICGMVLGGFSAIMLFVTFFTGVFSYFYVSNLTYLFLSLHFGLGFAALLMIIIHRCHTKMSKRCDNRCGRVCGGVSMTLWIIAVGFAYVFGRWPVALILIPSIGVLAGLAGGLQFC